MPSVAKSKKKPSHPPLWNPELLEKKHLPEPFDELQMDWVEELAYYVASNKHRIFKNELADGWYSYEVTDIYNRPILSVETSRDLQVTVKRSRKKRK